MDKNDWNDLERNLVEELREHKRISVCWDASVRFAGAELACNILNVSLCGAKIELDTELKPGIELKLDIPGCGALSGRVVWSLVNQAGIILDDNADTVRVKLFSRARSAEREGC